jgi:glycerol-3-phosphate dehydrogenase (NAD(P)+)
MRDADVVALGVSSAGVRWAAAKLKPLLRAELPILMIAKGLEWLNGSLRILPDLLGEELSSGSPHAVTPVAVGGPCIAGELARRVESCVVFASRDRSRAEALASLARTPYYHVTTSSDVVGVEACAALKNAYAMGIAFAQGIHERRGGKPGSIAMHNHEAAVFAQSVLEMQRVVAIMGGDPTSAVGLAGVGDLDVTCNGGRTGRFGKLLGSGIGVAAAIEKMAGATLECLEILGVLRLALAELEARGVLGANELPLLRQLMVIALDDAPPEVRFEGFFDQSENDPRRNFDERH